MPFFKRVLSLELRQQQELEELTAHLKCVVAWRSWNEALKSKESVQNESTTWLDNVNIRSQRFGYFAQLDTDFSKAASHNKVKESAQKWLDSFQGDRTKLIDSWRVEIVELQKNCARIEDELRKTTIMPLSLSRPLVALAVSQPSYAFTKHCFTSLANAAKNDPRLALDDNYFNFFKHVSGFMVLGLELGIYNATSPAYGKMMLIQALLCNEEVLRGIHHCAQKHFPGRELSILSGVKQHVSNIGTLLYFMQICASSPWTYESFIRWGTMAMVMVSFNKICELSSSLFGKFVSKYGKFDQTIAQNVTYQLLQLAVYTYLYPWMLESIDAQLLASNSPRDKALETLGLPQDATPEEIKAQMRKLIKAVHPDHGHSKEATDRTAEILAAAAVLRN
jgi:hypothetical protein